MLIRITALSTAASRLGEKEGPPFSRNALQASPEARHKRQAGAAGEPPRLSEFPHRIAGRNVLGLRGARSARATPVALSAARPVTNMAVKLDTTASRADALAGFELFQDLPCDELASLSRRCQWRRYGAQRIILGYRDDGREVFFVVRGLVRVTFFSESGREVSFRDLPAGEMFGELSAIDGLPRSCTVVALTDARVAVISASRLWDLLRQHESVNACILRRLTRLVRVLSERVVELSTLTVRRRIQVELLRLARETAPGQKCAVIFPAPTHAELASRVSTHREAVTRGLGELSRAGIVERRSGTLVIRDVEALAAMVDEVLSE